MARGSFSRTCIAIMLATSMMVGLVAAPAPQRVQATPTLLLTLLLATGAAVVVDAAVCGFDIFFYCSNGSGGNEPIDGCTDIDGFQGSPPPGCQVPDANHPGQCIPNGKVWNGTACVADICTDIGGEQATVPPGCRTPNPNPGACIPPGYIWYNNAMCAKPCLSTPNACGLTSPGAIVAGSCTAVTPSNSTCPSPVIDGTNFSADPARVRKGTTTTLQWDIDDATTCSLTGGGLSLTGLPVSGSRESNPIEVPTLFTLQCINGDGGPSASGQVTVTVIPEVQEI